MESSVSTYSLGKTEAPVTSEQFLNRSSSWTLACDNALLNRLKTFSDRVSKQSQAIMSECDNLSTQIDLLHSGVQAVTNEFLILSNSQFTENRVEEFQEMTCSTPRSQNVPVKTKAEEEAELIARMKEAIKIGVGVKTQQQLKRDNPGASKFPMKLPYIIGTPKFFSSRYCGLVDEMGFNPNPTGTGVNVEDIPEDRSNSNTPTPCTTSDLDFSTSIKSATTLTDSLRKDANFDDLLFPARELYIPPSLSQSFSKEGSPSSEEIGGRSPSITASSNSNPTKEWGNKRGSDHSSLFSQTKANSFMGDSTIRHNAPPSIVGDNSDDSDADFRPSGKGLRRSIFDDPEDDDDMFGETSLFGFKGKLDESEDLFTPKPTPKDFFSQNARPVQVLPPAPPLLRSECPEARDEKPSTIDVTTTANENVQTSKRSPIVCDINKELVSHVNLVQPSAQNPSPSQAELPKSSTAIEKTGRTSSLSSDASDTTHSSNSLERNVPTPKPKGFVKTMALGLKIDPTALHPGARPRRQASLDSTDQLSNVDNESSPGVIEKSGSSTVVPDQLKTPSLIPGAKAQIPSVAENLLTTGISKDAGSDSEKVHSTPDASTRKPLVPVPAFANTPSVTPPVFETPSVTTNNSDSVDRKAGLSIFDEVSSDEDLFKPVKTQAKAHSQKLFDEPVKKSPSAKASAASTNTAVSVPPPVQKIKYKSAQKTIFADSDSDDDLFGSNRKSINAKKIPILYPDDKDDIFSSTISKAIQPNQNSGSIQKPQNQVSDTKMATPVALGAAHSPKISESKPPPEVPTKVPTPVRPASPLFSNEPEPEGETKLDTSASEKTEPGTLILPKSKTFPILSSAKKGFSVKSIFDDSDSDDDSLFRSSSFRKHPGMKTADPNTSQQQVSDSSKIEASCKASFEASSPALQGTIAAKGNDAVGESATFKKADTSVPFEDSEEISTTTADHVFQFATSHPTDHASQNQTKSNKDVSCESGVSFDDTVTTSVLQSIAIAKSRAKVKANSRRPPSRRVPAPKERKADSESDDLSVATVRTSDDEAGTNITWPVEADHRD